ncbi:MAG: SSS family solute:Na+ symporter [Crocinitomicaceae bacterium]|jgi:SSS family solute:Na+ symporter
MDKAIHEYFTFVDWGVIFGYLLLTTIVGHCMRGKQGTIRDFFLGGRSLPWQAVSGSIIATEISGVTFIGVAGTLFALHGNFTYLLWGIGSVIGRVIVAKYFVPRYYEDEIYSPYDYMGKRLGVGVKKLATVIFTMGSILGQSVRVFVAAIPLEVVTGLPISICIIIIGLFAIGWTLMGGMSTVIWTDVMQFGLFTFGGLAALFWVITSLDGGWGQYMEVAEQFGRTTVWDARWGFDAKLEFTFWVALIAVPFQNLTAFGVDQLNAQRMFCCKNAKDASKALLWSCGGQLLTLLMLLVGTALFVHYNDNPFNGYEGREIMGTPKTHHIESDVVLAQTALDTAPRIEHPDATQYAIDHGIGEGEVNPLISNVAVPVKRDNVFPMWIVTQMPVGLSGLILAGVFAAAISSLDSILAALSQTTLSFIYHPEDKTDAELDELNLVTKSKWLVVMWGILLTGFTLLLVVAAQGIPVLPLAFGMSAYTMGPLLALFLCALIGRGSLRGLLIGASISFMLTMFGRMDVWVLVKKMGGDITWLANLPTYTSPSEGVILVVYCYAWFWPITTIVTLLFGLYFPRAKNTQS